MSHFPSWIILPLCLVLLVQAEKSGSKGLKKVKHKEASNLKNQSDYCYDHIEHPFIFFATKTSYRWNRNKNDDEITPSGCVAQQFWLLSRHGTRNPDTEEMKALKSVLTPIQNEIISNFKAGKGSLCKDDAENLEKWIFRANVDDDEFLVKEGFKELQDMGDRFQDRLPKLLTKPFINSSYIFKHTKTERTNASARAFAKGIFGKNDLPNVFFQELSSPDSLLKFDEICKKWKKDVHKNPKALIEITLFEEMEVASVIKSVSNRLGFMSPLNLSDINKIYTMCTFDKAWRPKKLSPWCAAFSKEELKILEYREDLKYYHEDGYGFPINYEQACMPLKDVLDRFRQVVEGTASSSPKGIFYFTHTATLLKVMTRFGLFKDAIIMKHSNRHLMKNREWRTSLINSFAANLALVLFNCSGDHYITAYVQERPIKLPGCSSELCKYEDFTKQYEKLAASCNIDEICRI